MSISLLWIGNSFGIVGGQNRVCYYACKELQKLGYSVSVAGQGSSVLPDGEVAPKSYNFNPNDIKSVELAIEDSKCDLALLSHDIWLFYFLPELKAKYPNIKFCIWGTVDAHPIHYSWQNILRAADEIVVSTQFGKDVIYQSFPEKSVDVIEYGIDQKYFRFPTTPKSVLKKQFGDANGLPNFDKKMVMVVASANQGKKGIGCIIDAFKMMNNPNTHLILNLKHLESQIGSFKYVGEFDLQGLIPGSTNISLINNHLDDASLANLFQLSDFLPYPSQGEAPGLQIGESQLCGVIPSVSNYTGMADEVIWKDFLLTRFILTRGQFNCYRAIVSAEELCEKMQMGYAFWEKLNSGDQAAFNTYKDVMTKAYEKFKDRTWENCALKFDKIFRNLAQGNTSVEDSLISV